MITIDDKLYITKEVNEVILDYARKVVIKDLLKQFSFEGTLKKKKKKVSNLLETVNFYNGDISPEVKIELIDFIDSFLNKLESKETTSLYFWTINNLYLRYLENLEHTSDPSFNQNDSEEVFNYKFGRMLAYKLYEPESTELIEELFQEIENLLVVFASEFDLSLIDKYTIQHIKETISNYSLGTSNYIMI